MNKKHFFSLIAVLTIGITLFSTCKKDKEDYRDKWVGGYDFTTIDYHEYGFISDSILTIEIDTIRFIGTIKKFDSDRLKITFKPDVIEPFPINGLMYLVVDELGALSYPEYSPYLQEVYLSGSFTGSISENTIIVTYDSTIGSNGPLGLRDKTNHTIQGTKINKK